MNLSSPSLLQSGLFINNQFIVKEQVFPVLNPATGEQVGSAAYANEQDVRDAINCAEKAQKLWQQESASKRSTLLMVWHDLIMANQDDLALLLTHEQGKSLTEAKGEIAYGASYIQWFAEEAKRVYGDVIQPPSSDKRLLAIKQPVGVVACITPWNFPNAMLTRKIAPALAAGCSVVCKPASETPLSALAIAQLALEAGLPPGLINVVTGKSSLIGEILTSSPQIRKISFTGSTEIGKHLLRACADTVKKVSMELGGNAPFIVFEDADLQQAVKGLIASKFRNSGQTCVCSNRIFVQKSIQQDFVALLKESINETLVLGNGCDEGVNQGPMIHERAVNDVHAKVADAIEQGATVITGARASELGQCFYEPTVLTEVTPSMRIAEEEIFGPVAPIISFESEQELITLANDTNVGLAAYFYSQNLSRIWRVSEQLEYGMVGVNEGIISNVMAPFGGVKESGMGREGSKYGIDDYLELKYICLGGLQETPAESDLIK